MAIVTAHTPGGTGAGGTAYLTTRGAVAYQRGGTLAVGVARTASRTGRAYISPACQITDAIVIDAASSAGRCPAGSVSANQRVGTVVIGTAHASGGTGTRLAAHLGTRGAGAYQITLAIVIGYAGLANRFAGLSRGGRGALRGML